MDRACSFLPRAESKAKFKQIKYWSVDFLHVRGHSASCPCKLYHTLRLARRFNGTNSSAAAQALAWFRKYARLLKETTAMRHSSKVLTFASCITQPCRKVDLLTAPVPPHGQKALRLLLLHPPKPRGFRGLGFRVYGSRSHPQSRWPWMTICTMKTDQSSGLTAFALEKTMGGGFRA